MKTLYAGARLFLLGTDVEDIVGESIIPFPIQPSTSLPCVAYHLVYGRDPETMDGPTGLSQSRVEFHCCDKSLQSADVLRTAVKQALRNQRGDWGNTGGSASNGVIVQGVNVVGSHDAYDGNLSIHHCIVEVLITWESL